MVCPRRSPSCCSTSLCAKGASWEVPVVRRERLWILIVVVVDLVASGCGRSKPAETGDASGETAPPGDGQPHGCHSDGECGPTMSCTSTHVCCAGESSDCIFRTIGPDSGITESFTACDSDDACASTEYCQSDISQCCPVGYLCDQATRPAVDGGAREDALTEDVRLPSTDAPRLLDAFEDGHVVCRPNQYRNLVGNCCDVGAVCSITAERRRHLLPPALGYLLAAPS